MKNKLFNLSCWIIFIPLIHSCSTLTQPINLNESQKVYLKNTINQIAEDDQRYRSYISLGTTDDKLVQDFKKVTDTMSIEQYLAYQKTLNYKLSKEKKDELWKLQHQLDLVNHTRLKRTISDYGYPSPACVDGIRDVFAILLHPPAEVDPQVYLDEMTTMLRPEVRAGRFEAKKYAMLYDNIKAKILGEPQLYGTNTPFDMKTMKPGLPPIANIKATNRARRKLGLPPLNQGEYQLVTE